MGVSPAGISVARVSRAARAEVGFTLRTEAAAAAALTRIDLVKVLVFTRDEAGTTDLEPADEAPVELPAVPAPPSEGGPEQVEGNQGTLAPGNPVRARHLAVAAVIVLVAVAMQTTLFTSLRPLDATPALGVLVVIAFSRHLREIDALVGGFLTGLLLDLLADSPLGLWALVATSVAFATVRLRDRMEDDFALIGPGGLRHHLWGPRAIRRARYDLW